MISVEEAQDFLMKEKLQNNVKTVSLGDSAGQVLAEDVFAERPQPPFNRVAMDGISLNSSAWSSLEYKKPLLFDQLIDAGIKTSKIGNSSITFNIGLFECNKKTLLTLGTIIQVYADQKTMKSTKLPENFIKKIKRFENI